MFESLAQRLQKTFEGLRKRGVIRESDLEATLLEIRKALLEADVALDVAKHFVEEVRTQALGQEVVRSITPDQMIIKIVHDHLVQVLGGETPPAPFALSQTPTKVMLVGLQGSGKTTSAAKIARFLTKDPQKRAVLASVDVYRPAALEQLETLAQQVPSACFVPATAQETPLLIARRALQVLKEQKADVLVVDTAGRLHTDAPLMQELQELNACINPDEILLVADMMTGQDALQVARSFSAALPLTGILLTRSESHSRGGVALSMRAETGCPIRLLGTGERLDQLEIFDAKRVAGRLLGMGDIVSLVEQAAEVLQKEDAETALHRLHQGVFTLEDWRQQILQVSKMGGISQILSKLPGVNGLGAMAEQQNLGEHSMKRQLAMIASMTPKERRHYKLLNGSRRRRIAAGSGCTVQEVNKLLKQYERMLEMQKRLKKMQNRPGLESKMRDFFGGKASFL
ncbi:MAG: signal recognition particle protein [Holosporales bacterium]|jgi:signal recognition particle subunit SRP54|nr:signal recognition particle protein [Holosporales bacterium]